MTASWVVMIIVETGEQIPMAGMFRGNVTLSSSGVDWVETDCGFVALWVEGRESTIPMNEVGPSSLVALTSSIAAATLLVHALEDNHLRRSHCRHYGGPPVVEGSEEERPAGV